MDEKALLAAAGEGLSSPQYVDLFRWLTSRLKLLCDLEENIISGPGESRSKMFEVAFYLSTPLKIVPSFFFFFFFLDDQE